MPRQLSERVKERMRHLRKRFPAARSEWKVDKDFNRLTADHPAHFGERTFWLGEIFAARWYAPAGHCGPPVAGLVLRQEAQAHLPILLAPGTKFSARASAGCHFFQPTEEPALTTGQLFQPLPPTYALDYRRPVPRGEMVRHLATLRYADRELLGRAMAAIFGWEESP